MVRAARPYLHRVVSSILLATFLTSGCRTPAPVITKALPHAVDLQVAPPNALMIGRPETPLDLGPANDMAASLFHSSITAAKVAATAGAITNLTPAETTALLAQLPPLPDVSTAPTPLTRPPTAAPPITTPATPIAFVAPTGKAVDDRPMAPPPLAPMVAPTIEPTGEVRSESEIRIRFDESIVPVAAVGANVGAIATISPSVVGTWRWIDTRVVQFTAATKFPGSTEFTVTVTAGLKSQTGAILGKDVVAKFSTAPVRIVATVPTFTYDQKLRTDSPLGIVFDQPIDPKAIAPYLVIESSKGKAIATKQIDLETAKTLWRKNPSFGRVDFDKDLGGNFVVVAPVTAWPAGLAGHVALKVGAPSVSGPRVTTKISDATFEVAAPFKFTGLTCDAIDKPRFANVACAVDGIVSAEFSNAIDRQAYTNDWVKLAGEPEHDNPPSRMSVPLSIPDRVGKSFTVVVDPQITDVYGQPLGGERKASFVTRPPTYEPSVWAHATGLYVLDPRFTIPQWIVDASAIPALDIELRAVTPADYFAYRTWADSEKPPTKGPPGKVVFAKSYPIGVRSAGTVRVDLRPVLGAAGTGHILAIARSRAGGRTRPEAAQAWIEVTKLAVSARMDGERLRAWTSSIVEAAFLAPVPNATISMLVSGRTDMPAPATTDATGAAQLEFPPHEPPNKDADPDAEPIARTAMLVVKTATDSAFVEVDRYEKSIRTNFARWYVTDDRFTYRPGESVFVKGWVRYTHDGINPDLALPKTGGAVTYALVDSRGNKLGTGSLPLGDQGGFDGEIAIPENAALGGAQIELATSAGPVASSTSRQISIEEFRTPTFAVTLEDDVDYRGARPLIVGETLAMRTEAKYYAGGSLGGAAIKWSATLEPAAYRPPGWDEYSFEALRPRDEDRGDERREIEDKQEGTLDAASTSEIAYALAAVAERKPAILSVDVSVTDLDRRTVRASSRKILVHPSAYYVGLRKTPGSSPRGGSLDVIVTDVDGAIVPNVAVSVALEGVLGSTRYNKTPEVRDTQTCKVTSAASPVHCTYTVMDDLTQYDATAEVADTRGRINRTRYPIPWWTTSEKREDFAVVPDKQTYRAGDIAKIDIRSVTLPATVIVSFARQGVISQQRLELTKPSTILELPILASHIPNISVVVDRWRRSNTASEPMAGPLPEHETRGADLEVDLESARLVMTAKPRTALVKPGDMATFDVTVRRNDKPVANAEVALMAIDEAILSLATKRHIDPLAGFYRRLRGDTTGANSMALIHDQGPDLDGKPGIETWNLDDPNHVSTGYGYGGGRGMAGHTASYPSVMIGSVSSTQANMRKDFRATAVWSPRLHTDADGHATVTVKMPDNLTRYRIVALGTEGIYNFGKAEGTIVTALDVNARTTPPRFLVQGDTFALPVVVQNLGSKARTVDVAVRAVGLVGSGPNGKRVTIPGNQRAEVRFDFATAQRGRSVIQTIVKSDEFVDALETPIQVYTPMTTESFATYGTVDDKAAFERVAVPSDIFAEVGGVEAEVSSTQLQSLTDAYWYLQEYPHECAEQRSGRMLATAAMADILEAFRNPSRPTADQLAAQRATDLAKLVKDQNQDGGWGYFRRMESDPFVTMQVLGALVALGDKSRTLKDAVAYVTRLVDTTLGKLETRVKLPLAKRRDRERDPYDVGVVALGISALASARDGKPLAARLHAAALALDAYSMDARARVLAIVAKSPKHKAIRTALLADLLAQVRETAAGATVSVKFTDGERMLLGSDTRTTALVMTALIAEVPDHAAIVKLARGLLAARSHGRWRSTQENLVVLQSMRRYFDAYEKVTPNFTGKLWFGTTAYAEKAFAGHTNERARVAIDWSTLGLGKTHDVALGKDGPGRMYYRLGITYAPKALALPAIDAGFIVRRTYKAVDDPKDVVQTGDQFKVKLGARIVVDLEVLNTTTRYGVALVDPLPAGFEPVNTKLATSERAVAGADAQASSDTWDFVSMRDDRGEAFAMTLPPGTHHLTYTARATVPGSFRASPTKAEEMYAPETFGRSWGGGVVIE